MTGTQKLIGWVLFAALVLVAIFTTLAHRPHPEGYTGSYLGRTVADGSDSQGDALRTRAATQRF